MSDRQAAAINRHSFIAVVLIALGVLLSGRTGRAQDSSPSRLRVLCYNIHHGEGTDGKLDLERLARVITAARPDLVALQEVDDQTRRTDGVDQTAKLARLTGLHGRFAKAIDYQGGGYGQALLCRYPLGKITVHWLPGEPDRERRIVATAKVELPTRVITFATTHLHHQSAEFRLKQAEEINRVFAGIEGPSIVVGDFNAVPGSPPIETMLKHWTSTTAGSEPPRLTFPAGEPNRQLDYVFVRPEADWRVLKTEVLDEPVTSDHRPLLVELAY